MLLIYIPITRQNKLNLTNLALKTKFVNKKDKITNPTFKLSLAKIIDRIVGAWT
jgi:hypothetical protein